jgi:hypothetical protein
MKWLCRNLVDDHQVAIMREFFHQPFDDVTAQHRIERRARRSADHNRIDIEGLGRIGKGLGSIVRHSPVGTISI